jgi:pyridoxamine 5'-phosphate oxidase
VIAGREDLARGVADAEARFDGRKVERPPHWGGFQLLADRIEFWQGHEHRLHDRFVYTRVADGWRIDRLAP